MFENITMKRLSYSTVGGRCLRCSSGNVLVECAIVLPIILVIVTVLCDITLTFFWFYEVQSTLEEVARHIAVERSICRSSSVVAGSSVSDYVSSPDLLNRLERVKGGIRMTNAPLSISYQAEGSEITKDIFLLRLEAETRDSCFFCFVPIAPTPSPLGMSKLYC
jgi:Flp pilus assembly protein TadG